MRPDQRRRLIDQLPDPFNQSAGLVDRQGMAGDAPEQRREPAGDPLTAILVTNVTHGALTLNANGSFSYSPAVNYNGGDSFTYKANDGTADSNVVTVTLTINPINDAPGAVDDAYAVGAVTAFSVPALSGILANDSDPAGDPLTAVLVSGTTNGILTINADGSFTYTPNPGYTGADAFLYQASDGVLLSNIATVTLAGIAAPGGPGSGGPGVPGGPLDDPDNDGFTTGDAFGVIALAVKRAWKTLRHFLAIAGCWHMPGRGVARVDGNGRLAYAEFFSAERVKRFGVMRSIGQDALQGVALDGLTDGARKEGRVVAGAATLHPSQNQMGVVVADKS